MSAIVFLTSWANSPFAIAIGAVCVFALLQATGLLGLIAGGADHDLDHDIDADVDADADVDHDVDADHDGHADGDHEGDHDADGADRGLAAAVAGLLGFGTLPLSILWQSFGLAFGAAGMALNFRFIDQPGAPPAYTLLWTVPASLAFGCAAVAALNKVLGPVLSSKGQEATSRAQLVGQIGVVISSKVDRDFGEVRIRDRSGHDLRVVCRLAGGAKALPTERQSVVVVDCDDKGGLLVAALDEDEHDEENEEARPSAR